MVCDQLRYAELQNDSGASVKRSSCVRVATNSSRICCEVFVVVFFFLLLEVITNGAVNANV